MKIEIDCTEMIEGINDLKYAIKEVVDAWHNLSTSRGLRKAFKKIRFGESNNYLKYHKKPMKRRRYIK